MLAEKILDDYKNALKNKDKVKTLTLSLLRSNIKNEAIKAKKESIDDNEIITVIKRMVKQHQDSIEQFKKGQREDLVVKESEELAVLKLYLPAEMPIEEIKQVIEEVVFQMKASSIKDMGRVIKEVMAKIGHCADGKIISGLVKDRLCQ